MGTVLALYTKTKSYKGQAQGIESTMIAPGLREM